MEIKSMAKSGEINYLKNLGPAGIQHSMNKPFSDVRCHHMLTEIGAIFTILPPPPARLLIWAAARDGPAFSVSI
jgi:hypothetical protein